MSVVQVDISGWKSIPCECGKKARQAAIKYKGYEVRGWKCSCGNDYIHPEDSLKVSKLEKSKGVEVKVGLLGDSVIIRIPKELSEIYGIRKGSTLKLVPEGLSRIEIRKK
ncbi:MAG: AbrB/MazE/SpoVT family DNA-binding domain-containing protein [Candidatus Aenigmarchaeota archaeon]|nr:AbrB/MazE/SpoVT family DNA-binding domain-containing protein [Candidatus Aenigmarchaeota archaeon]